MGYSISWLLEERVLDVALFDIVSVTEARILCKDILEYITAGTAPVHILIDLRKLKFSPPNIQLNRELTETYLTHPNAGRVIAIGGNIITRFMAKLMTRLIKVEIKQLETREEAILTLKKLDISLGDLSIE